MEKFTIEQKAKLYDEVVERAKEIINNQNASSVWKGWLCNCFPELAESKDERIRKVFYGWIYTRPASFFDNGISKEDMIAWLEKQGKQKPYGQREECLVCQFNYAGECKGFCAMKRDEQKPQRIISVEAKETFFDYENANIQQKDFAPKIKSKFKVGNWYQCTKDFFGKGVTFDKNTAYYCAKEGCLQNEYGCHIAIVKDLYDNFKLWDISDAKKGDVLASKNGLSILIFRNLDTSTSFSSYYNIQGRGELGWSNNVFIPATKEQRDFLFRKMEEEGYEWDTEKKELKKIEESKNIKN